MVREDIEVATLSGDPIELDDLLINYSIHTDDFIDYLKYSGKINDRIVKRLYKKYDDEKD